MEKSKEALSGSDECELGDNSAKGDNQVEPIPESSSRSAAFPEESLEGMEQQIGSNTLTVNSESVETSEHILIHVEAPNDLHTGGSDRSGPENSQMKNQIRKLTNQVKTLQTKLNDHRKNRKITKQRLGKGYYYFILYNYSKSSPIYIIFCAFA